MKIVCLTTSPIENEKLEEASLRMGHTFRFIDPNKVYQYISEFERGYDRFYYGSDGEEPERIHAGTIDCVIPRIGANVGWASSILRFLVENIGAYCPNNFYGQMFANNKAFTLQRLSSSGIKVPRTIVAESPAHVKWAVEKLGIPIVIKTIHGSEGIGVAICDTKESANSMFEFCFNTGLKVLLEEFIEAGGIDYRVWVVGDKVAVTMKRTAQEKGQFKANISRGGKGEKVELSKEDQELCIKAAHSIGLGVAGVDLMKDKTGKSYIIEINSNPGIKIIDICNYNPFIDIVEYCEQNYKSKRSPGNGKDSARVSDLLIDGTFMSGLNELMRQNDILKEHIRNEIKELK
jgi:ribosomal protein S6--L-glutamate ligase